MRHMQAAGDKRVSARVTWQVTGNGWHRRLVESLASEVHKLGKFAS